MKTKFTPAILTTRAAMEAEVSLFIQSQLRHTELIALVEQEKLAVERQHEKRLNALVQEMERHAGAVQNYCTSHRRELLTDNKKSFETATAYVGFRDTPAAVDKITTKETWGAIAKRLLGLVFVLKKDETGIPIETLDCANYVREKDPEVNKDAIQADRSRLTADQLYAMGVKFTTEENFYIEPKSLVAEGIVAEA